MGKLKLNEFSNLLNVSYIINQNENIYLSDTKAPAQPDGQLLEASSKPLWVCVPGVLWVTALLLWIKPQGNHCTGKIPVGSRSPWCKAGGPRSASPGFLSMFHFNNTYPTGLRRCCYFAVHDTGMPRTPSLWQAFHDCISYCICHHLWTDDHSWKILGVREIRHYSTRRIIEAYK